MSSQNREKSDVQKPRSWDEQYSNAALREGPAEQAGYPQSAYQRRLRFLEHVCQDISTQLQGKKKVLPSTTIAVRDITDTAGQDCNPKILDIGGNSGWMFSRVVSKDTFSVGSDRVLPILRVAKQQLRYETVLQSDGCNLPFADQTFDFCTVFDVLTSCGDPKSLLSEAFRVLHINGSLVVESSRSFNLAYTLFIDLYRHIRYRRGVKSFLALARRRILVCVGRYEWSPKYIPISAHELISWSKSLGPCDLHIHLPKRFGFFPQPAMAVIIAKRQSASRKSNFCSTCTAN